MKFVVCSFLFGVFLLNFPGCLSNVEQDVSTKKEDGIAFAIQGIVTTKIGGETVSSSVVEDIFEDDTVITGSINSADFYRFFDFGKWYGGGENSNSMDSLRIRSFENVAISSHIINSPYFWISFWNGYEQHKNTNIASNKLDAMAIKKIFQKYTNNSNKAFIEAILTFAEKASKVKSMSTQRVELTNAIRELKKGDNASNPVTHFENLILHGLQYSINKTLQGRKIFVNFDTKEFDFKKDESIKDFKNKVSNAMRGLTILKGSIEQMMLPTLIDRESNEIAAVNAQSNHIKKIDNLIKKIKETFDVTDSFTVHKIETDVGNSCILVLTDDEITRIGTEENVGTIFMSLDPNISHEILDGYIFNEESVFLKRITNTRNAQNSGLIPSLLLNIQ